MDEAKLQDYLSLFNSPTLNQKIDFLKKYRNA
jgi:hypothetical protein